MNAHQGSKISITEEYAREIERIYDGLLEKLAELSGSKDTELVSKTIVDLIDYAIERLSSEDECLLLYTNKIFDKDYIFSHSLNVCLVSLRIGLRLGFDKKRLKDLGLGALTHASKDMKFPEGLLKGIKHDKESDEITKLADVYDALSHPPSYRHAMTPRETLGSIINTDKFFDPRLIKILLEELSFYPKGSWVQLSTNEIGGVIKAKKELPLRPTVKVFIDWEGNYLKEAKTIDLSKKNTIYVLRPLTEEEIKHKKKLEI